MKITVLGCGNSFSIKNFNTSFLLEDSESDNKLLIDCGNLTLLALYNAGFSPKDITHIYISHNHADHCGGLENIAFFNYDWKRKPSSSNLSDVPTLICNERLLPKLWENTLKGGLQSIEGFETTLETFFKLKPVKDHESFNWSGWDIQLIQQIHTMNGNCYNEAFGLIMSKKYHQTVYFTTDGVYMPQLNPVYSMADIIFQDCECTPFSSGAHSNYFQMVKDMPESFRKKIWLCHYQDFVSSSKDFNGNTFDWNTEAIKSGFKGFNTVGQVIEIQTHR